MSSSFLLRLDTHAPQVTWGAHTGEVAGERLRVAYTLDEPAIISARLVGQGGRTLAMEVLATELAVDLPPDFPAGEARVYASVADDVGNTAERELALTLSGTIIVPPDQPPVTAPEYRPFPPAPRPVERPEPRTVRSTSHAVARSHIGETRTRQSARSPTTSRSAARLRPVSSRHASRAAAATAAHDRATAAWGRSAAQARPTSARTRRRDGPDLEALLLALDP